MALAEAARRFGPCPNCRPPIPTAGPPPNAAPLVQSAAPSAVNVSTPGMVTRTGQKYHRADCRTLRGGGILHSGRGDEAVRTVRAVQPAGSGGHPGAVRRVGSAAFSARPLNALSDDHEETDAVLA